MLLTIAIPIDKINTQHIIYKEIIKNKILNNSTFCKLLYSNENCSINGIPIFVNIVNHNQHTKYKFYIHKYANTECIKEINVLEHQILKNYSCNKKPIYKIKDTLHKGVLKINTERPISPNFIIKITGIWETEQEYGLTYRITNH